MLRVLTDTSIRGRARTVVAAIPEPTGPGVAGSTGNRRFHERGQRHPHLGLGVDHVGRTVDDRRAVVNGVVEGRPRSRPGGGPVGWTAATIARTATVHAGQRHRGYRHQRLGAGPRGDGGGSSPRARGSASPATPASG